MKNSKQPSRCASLRQVSPHVYLWMRQSGATLTGLHSKVNTLIETTRKPSVATRLRDLVAGDSGFTLLETLAVMVIIGLLAAITVPQIAKWREKAYITSLKTDARNIANAVEVFYVDDQIYPTAAEFTTLVAADVKLNPGNAIYTINGYATGFPGNGWRSDGMGTIFLFWVYSSKTDSRALYISERVPAIEIIP